MSINVCLHPNIYPSVMDQTLGVICPDCNLMDNTVCWSNEHVSEKLWNKACGNDPTFACCDENREDFCAICGDKF